MNLLINELKEIISVLQNFTFFACHDSN